MRVMVLVKATADSEKGFDPTPEAMEAMQAMDKFNDELVAAGIRRAVGGLKPSSEAKRIAFDGQSRTVIEGPFDPPGELVAGFWIWECKSLQEAIDWAKKCPRPHNDDSELEIRQIFAPEDFGDVAPEVIAREEEMRREFEARKKT